MDHYLWMAFELNRSRRGMTIVEYAAIAGIIAATVLIDFSL